MRPVPIYISNSGKVGPKRNFLSLRIPKNDRLAGQDLERFKRLRMEREALLRREDNQVVDTSTAVGF